MSERGGVLQGNFIQNFLIKISFVKQIKIAFILYIYRCCRNAPKKHLIFTSYIQLLPETFQGRLYDTMVSTDREQYPNIAFKLFLHFMDLSSSIFQRKSRHHLQSESDTALPNTVWSQTPCWLTHTVLSFLKLFGHMALGAGS